MERRTFLKMMLGGSAILPLASCARRLSPVANLIDLLNSGAPEVTLTAAVTRLDDPYTLDHPVKINGDGKQLIIGQGGKLTYQPNWPGQCVIDNAQLGFVRMGINAQERGIVAKAGLELTNNDVTINCLRAAGPNLNTYTPAWLVDVDAPSNCGPVIMKGNKVRGLYPYGGGFVFGRNMTGVEAFVAEDNDLERCHGTFQLTYGRYADFRRNSMRRCSWGNFVTGAYDDVTIEDNSTITPGDGAAGDSITIGNGNRIKIRRHTSVGGSCYGFLLQPSGGTLDNVDIEDCSIIGHLTSAIYAAGPIGNLAVRGSVMGFNGGWGIAATQINAMSVNDNLFLHNADHDAAPQHLFWNGVNIASWSGNKRGSQYTSAYPPVADGKYPYVDYPL